MGGPFQMITFDHWREGGRVDKMLFKYHVIVKGGGSNLMMILITRWGCRV